MKYRKTSIDVSNLKNQSGAEFSAVVIINKCMAGRPYRLFNVPMRFPA
jgi:hypothetical protein